MFRESVVLFRLKLKLKGKIRFDRIDLPILGEVLKEMVGELKSRSPEKALFKKPKGEIKYPLKRNGRGRIVKPGREPADFQDASNH